MNEQLIFKFPYTKDYSKQDYFVSNSNSEAYDLIDSWPKWVKKTVNIFGPPGSGKSHLASIFESKGSTIKIKCKDLSDKIFFQFKPVENLIVEDVDENVSENILYSLYNVVSQDNKYLLVTSKKALSSYNFKLTDLQSRVNSTLSIEIKLPTDDLMNVILSKNFSDKQITVDKKHIDYIIKRIDRSYEKISKLIIILDSYTLKQKKPFNFKIIKEALEMLKV